MDWILKHKVLAVLLVVIVAFTAWYFLSGSSSSAAPVLSSDQTQSNAPGASDLVASLLALRAVTLSGTIFSDPSFQQLQDFSTPVVPEPVGRTDPFAPLSGGTSPSPASAKAAQIFKPKPLH